MVRSASEYLFLQSQDSFPEEAFQECYAMKHEEELRVQDEMEVTRSEKTDCNNLNMGEGTPSCLGDNVEQCTVYTLGQDVRKMEGTREEKNLREAKNEVVLMDTLMAENNVTEARDVREDKDKREEKDKREDKDEREEKDESEEDEREDIDEREVERRIGKRRM